MSVSVALSFLEVESKIPSWVRPGLTFDSNILTQIYLTVTSTSHIYDRVIFLIALVGITWVLWYKKLIKEAMFNVLCVLPGLISGNMWNAFRFDTAIFTFYLGCCVIATRSSLHRYTILSLFLVISMVCWFYWLSGSYYFA